MKGYCIDNPLLYLKLPHFSQGLLEGFDRVMAGEDVHRVCDIILPSSPSHETDVYSCKGCSRPGPSMRHNVCLCHTKSRVICSFISAFLVVNNDNNTIDVAVHPLLICTRITERHWVECCLLYYNCYYCSLNWC